MKKVIGALLIGVFALAVASYAQLALGVEAVADANSLALRYDFAGGIIGKLGVNYNNLSVGGASTSTTGYGGQVAYALPAKLGNAQPIIGVNYSSDGATTATTVLSLRVGAEIEPVSGVLLSAGIAPYVSTSVGGAAATTLMTTDQVWIAMYCKL